MLVFHKFSSKIFDINYFKNSNFLTKTKRCLLWIQKRILSLKLSDVWQLSEKQNHISQNSKSYEISSTGIYVGEDLKFIICVFFWCIPLDHEIYTKCKKTSNLIKVISVIISALEIEVNNHKNIHLSFSTKNFWVFLEFFCSIASTHFQTFNYTCALNR